MIDHDSAPVSQPAAPIKVGQGPGSGQQTGAQRPKGRTSALALRNWRVRWRLLALIAIPTATAIALGGIRIQTAIHSAGTFQRIEQLAVLGGDVTKLAQAMEDERDITAGFIAAGRPVGGRAALQTQYAVTDAQARAVRAHAASIGSAYPAATREQLAAVLARIDDLEGLRVAALSSKLPALPMITDYSQAVAEMFAVNDDIAQDSANPALSDSVRTLGLLSRMKDQASQQRAILYAAFISGQITPNALSALTSAKGQQASELATFMASTTVGQRQRYADTVTGTQDDLAQDVEQRAITLGSGGTGPLLAGTTSAAASRQWYSAMSATIAQMRAAESQVVGSIIAQSRALQRAATRSALLIGIAVLLILVLVLVLTAIIARSMVRPLRRLRAGALDVAGIRLPEKVRQFSDAGGAGRDFRGRANRRFIHR